MRYANVLTWELNRYGRRTTTTTTTTDDRRHLLNLSFYDLYWHDYQHYWPNALGQVQHFQIHQRLLVILVQSLQMYHSLPNCHKSINLLPCHLPYFLHLHSLFWHGLILHCWQGDNNEQKFVCLHQLSFLIDHQHFFMMDSSMFDSTINWHWPFFLDAPNSVLR